MLCKAIFKSELYRELSDRYGEMIGGNDLARVLGYSTSHAFRKAVERGTLSLTVFHVKGRAGRFALTADVTKWLIEKREQVGPCVPLDVHHLHAFQTKKGEN